MTRGTRRGCQATSALSALVAATLLAGCATTPFAPPPELSPVELTGVPFFPQRDYQCGPAALATVLAHEGVPVDADDLVAAIYVEGLRGSLQPELLGATRRHGHIPYVLPPTPEALFAELAAGRPVLVLQNLGLDRLPIWHYAVVVGFDPATDRVILRSGTEQRRQERSARFLRTWQRGDNWAFVALTPGELPATPAAAPYVRALAGAEPLLAAPAADAAFAAALERWPDDELVLLAAANRRLVVRDFEAAEQLYRKLLALAPHHAAARNNLANALAERGCVARALAEARAALGAVETGSELHAPISETLAMLELAAAAAGAPPADCP